MAALFLVLLVVSASALEIPILEHLPIVGKYFSTVKMEDNLNTVGKTLGNLGKFMQDLKEGIHTDANFIIEKIVQVNSYGTDINFMVNGVNSGILSPSMIRDMIKGMSFPLCDLVEEIIYPVMKTAKKMEAVSEKIQTAARAVLSIITTQSFGLLEKEQQRSTIENIVEKLTQNEMKALKKILDELIVDIKEAEVSGPPEPELLEPEEEELIYLDETPVTVTPEDKERKKVEL